MKLSVKGLALSLGLTWSLCMLAWGLLATYANWNPDIYNMMGGLYLGTKATLTGVIIGAVWAFFDGLVGGALIAWLYNKFSK